MPGLSASSRENFKIGSSHRDQENQKACDQRARRVASFSIH
jgi:hypothetical protein